MTTKRALPALLVAFVLAAWPVEAQQLTSDVAAAKQHSKAGTRLFQASRYREALAEFLAGYEAHPAPGFLFNVAECYRNLGDAERATENFERYLNEAPDGVMVNAAKEQLALVAPERDRIVREREAAALAARTTVAAAPVSASSDSTRRVDQDEDDAKDQVAPRVVEPVRTGEPVTSVSPSRERNPAPPHDSRRKARTIAIVVGAASGVFLISLGIGLGVSLSPGDAPTPNSSLGAAPVTLRFQ